MTVKQLFAMQLSGAWNTSGLGVQWRYDKSLKLLEFQYTTSAEDWRQNFHFFPRLCRVRYIAAFAHHGFVDMFNSVWREIYPIVDCDEITIAGYSQGAALASLFAFAMRAVFDTKVRLITFGCPRIYWGLYPRSSRELFAGDHYMVRGDIVTHVPFAFMGFSRGGMAHRIGPHRMIWWTHHRPEEYLANLPDTEA